MSIAAALSLVQSRPRRRIAPELRRRAIPARWRFRKLYGRAEVALEQAADVFAALYALPKNDTLNGLTPPLNYHSGAPASQVTCFFLAQIQGGKLTAPKGSAPICPS